MALTIKNDIRVSANDAYLEPARDRPNLEVIGEALVDRIEFEGGRAAGVRLHAANDGAERRANQSSMSTLRAREILICAGAVYSPAILMRSGVGPAHALRGLGITPIVDLPGVGENVLDHPAVGLHLTLRAESQAGNPHARRTNCCVRYTSGLANTGFNDMLIASCNVYGIEGDALARGVVVVSVYQAFSKGRLRISSPDPAVNPVIEERMLSDERDLIRLREGVRKLFEIGRHPAYSRRLLKTCRLGIPSAEVHEASRALRPTRNSISGFCRSAPIAITSSERAAWGRWTIRTRWLTQIAA